SPWLYDDRDRYQSGPAARRGSSVRERSTGWSCSPLANAVCKENDTVAPAPNGTQTMPREMFGQLGRRPELNAAGANQLLDEPPGQRVRPGQCHRDEARADHECAPHLGQTAVQVADLVERAADHHAGRGGGGDRQRLGSGTDEADTQ